MTVTEATIERTRNTLKRATGQTAGERVRELRAEYLRLHDTKPTSGYTLDAYVRYHSEASQLGLSPTALNAYAEDEVERFFAYTVPGTDGHVYWTGGKIFKRNDGATRLPGRWWWEHANGALGIGDSVYPTCGQRGCVNPEHAARQDRQARHRLFSDDQLIGAIQVLEMRIGHTPTRDEWIRAGTNPSASVICLRFGGWERAMAAAGLKPHGKGAPGHTAEQCVASVKRAHEILGRWPTSTDYKRPEFREKLRQDGLPTSLEPLYRILGGTWAEIVAKAQAA